MHPEYSRFFLNRYILCIFNANLCNNTKLPIAGKDHDHKL